MLLFYIRHGDPIYTPDSLTPLGKRQAEAVGKRLAMHGIDQIYSSTSNRAYETATPLSELLKKDITQLDFLNEQHAWEYFTAEDKTGKCRWIYNCPEIKELLVKQEVFQLGYRWYDHPEFAAYKFKEGIEFFEKNTDAFMESLGYVHDRSHHTYQATRENHDRVAVFAHEGMGSIFLSSLLDIPYSLFVAHYAMSHTGMTVVKFEETGTNIIPQVLQFSSDAHLYREGIPTFYCNKLPI